MNKLQNGLHIGCLGLTNFRAKDMSLKVNWVVETVTPGFVTELAFRQLNPLLRDSIWSCNLKKDDIMVCFEGGNFWTEVLIAWSQIHFRAEIEPENIGAQIIWFNSAVKIDGKTVFWKKAYKRGFCESIVRSGKLYFRGNGHGELWFRFFAVTCANHIHSLGVGKLI